MLVTLHIFLGCVLAGLALRAGEMIAGAWAMRLAMRKALKAYQLHSDIAESYSVISTPEAQRARASGKASAN